MNFFFLIINLIILIYEYKLIQISSSDIPSENGYFDEINDLNMRDFNNNIYLPEYQNKFSRINELNDTNFNFMKIKNNRSVVLVPDSVISKNERLLEIQNVDRLINQINNINNNSTTSNKKITKNKKEIYTDDYSFYGSTSGLNSDYNYKYIKKNALIYDKGSSSIKDIIGTEPEEIKIEYEICKPISILFKINNLNPDEHLVIKDIRTDLYQVKIFPYISNKNNNNKDLIPENLTPDIKSYLEHSIYPRTVFSFQLLFLLDFKTKIKGTLYIEFNDKKVLLIPIQIFGHRNNYSVEPIYRTNFQTKKLFEEYIQLANPTSKTIYIQDIIHSFEKIKVFWANGEAFNNTTSVVNTSMLKIDPFTSEKRLLIIRYYPKIIENEYGFIQIRTDESILVIPVLINFVNSPIITEPRLLNFGICDISQGSRNNFIRIIPLKLLNNGKEYIKIGKVYINYDELFLQFHQNYGGNNIIIKPNDKVLFGYFIFNANIEERNYKKIYNLTNIDKKIYIETNSTQMPLVELSYTYTPYTKNELQEVTGNIQLMPNSGEMFSFFLNVKFKKGIKLRSYSTYLPGENITIRDKYLVAKVKNPSNENQYINSQIFVEVDRISELKSIFNYYLPLLLNDMQYTIIPIHIENNDLIKIYCGDEDNSKTLAICKKNLRHENEINTIKIDSNKKKAFNIDFGQVPSGVIKTRFIYLINENNYEIEIKDIISSNLDPDFLVDFEGYEYIGNKDEQTKEYIKYPDKGYLKNKLKKRNINEPISILIFPYTAVKLSITLFSKSSSSNKNVHEEIIFLYNSNYKFILSLNATILYGYLSLSERIYNYEPAFCGLYQKKVIEARNNYNFPIKILSVSSSDKRIIPVKLTDQMKPNLTLALVNVNFDPSKNSEFKIDYELNMSTTLTYRELYLWKIEDKYFNKMQALGQSTINANVSVKTSVGMEYINFNALIIKPNLVKKSKINFGLNQIGKSQGLYIEGRNPSDKMLMIKLVLADDYYYDIDNNNMFNKKDKFLLEKNIDLFIFSCTFVLKINSTSVLKFEYIIVPEKIDPLELREGIFDKKELIKLIYKYGNEKVKNYVYKAENILCKYDKKKQSEILFNKNNEYNHIISQAFSEEFNNDIDSVKNMTYKNIEEKAQYKFVEKKSIFRSIFSYLFDLYLKYYMNMYLYSNINIIENTQSFFIPKEMHDKIYKIPPHMKFSIGPIIFKPNRSGIIRGTLFLKNNLTLLYPLKLEGEGGGGIIHFIDYYRDINKKRCKIFNEKNLVIEIDEEIYETEIKNSGNKFNRTISLMNVGNLPLIIKNITIDNTNECRSNNLRILQCKEISINPKEIVDIDFEISPNYRNKGINKIIYFNTEYQSFYLNVVILLSDDFFEKQNFIWIYFKCFVIVFIIINIILYCISRIISLIQKQKREMCNKDSNRENNLQDKEDKEKMLIENGKNKNDKTNNKQNKGNKKKKRKKSTQKEDIDILNNNKEEENNKDNNNENQNDKINENKNKENDIKEDINIIKEDKKENIDEEKKENIKQDLKDDVKDDNKKKGSENSKNKKRKVKNSVSSIKNEKENQTDKIKRENEEITSEDKKDKGKRKSTESNKYNNNNENEIYENNNYHYNKGYQNRYRKGKKEINKKFYYSNYSGNKKYNNNYYYYENNNNNYNSNTFNNNNYSYYQQPKKQVTKITIKEKNAKNLKELFENEENKSIKEVENNSKNKKTSKTKKDVKTKTDNENNYNNDINISNINNFNILNNESNNFNIDYNFSINKNKEKKNEEMNPIFLNDEKINKAFNTEQELIKSFKRDTKDINEEEDSKDEFNFDFNNESKFNFNYFFFDKNQQQEDEGEYTGNYEDYRYKSIIDNLNTENPFSSEEPKSKIDSLNMSNNKINSDNNKNEFDDKNEENDYDENEYLNSNKFNFNFMNLDDNF